MNDLQTQFNELTAEKASLNAAIDEQNRRLIQLRLAKADGDERQEVREKVAEFTRDLREVTKLLEITKQQLAEESVANQQSARQKRDQERNSRVARARDLLEKEEEALYRATVRLAVLRSVAAGRVPSDVTPESLPAIMRDGFSEAVKEVTL